LARGRALDLSRPVIMGVVNVTPDSFSDGGRLASTEEAVAHGMELARLGAGVLDIGGESTRPGAEPVSVADERARVVPVIAGLVAAGCPALVSVDTRKAEVAREALAAGAHVVNDVSALGDARMAEVVRASGAGLVLMHMRGEPRTMQSGVIHYDDVVGEVVEYLELAAARALGAGIGRAQLMVDPGLGFGKTTEHNVLLTRGLPRLCDLGFGVVYGASRKRFLGEITRRPIGERDAATAAISALAVFLGAHVIRVHDVAAVRDALTVAAALRNESR
jgi:dihydropteroate synthase